MYQSRRWLEPLGGGATGWVRRLAESSAKVAAAVGDTTPFPTLEFGYDRNRHWLQTNLTRIRQLLRSIFAEATLHAGYEASVPVGFLEQVS